MAREQSREHLRLLRHINRDYTTAVDYRSQFKEDWDRYYKMYRNRLTTDGTGNEYPFESKLAIPYIFSIIEAQLPLVMREIFSAPRFLETLGRNIQSELHAPQVNEIVRHQFERDINAWDLVYLLTKQAMMYGTSPSFADWDYKVRQTKARVPQAVLGGLFMGEQRVTFDRVIKNGPIADVIDLFRYFQCPTTPGNPWEDENVLYAGWEFNLTREEIFEKKRAGFYNNNVSLIPESNAADNTSEDYLINRLSVLGKVPSTNTASMGRPQVSMVQYFGQIPASNGRMEMHSTTIAYPNGLPKNDVSGGAGRGGGSGALDGIVVRDDIDFYDHGRIPIILTRVNYVKGDLYGIGDPEVAESLQIELNDQRNQRQDIVVQTMNPMWQSDAENDIDAAQLQYRPNGVVELDAGVDSLRPLTPNLQGLQLALTEESIIKQDIQFATGISDFFMGQVQNSSGLNDTATGISLITAAGQGRTVLKMGFIQRTIKNIAELVWALDAQFLPFDTVVRVLDPVPASNFRFIKVNPTMIAGQYDFTIVNAPSAGNAQVRQGQIIQLGQVLAQLMGVAAQAQQPVNISWPNMIRRILEEFNVPNIAQILPQLLETELFSPEQEGLQGLAEAGAQEALDPEAENNAFLEGAKDVPTHPGDDDLDHMLKHDQILGDVAADVEGEIRAHMTRHQEQMRLKNESIKKNAQGVAQELGGDAGGAATAGGSDLETLLGGGTSTTEPGAQSDEEAIRGSAQVERLVGN